MMLHHVVVVASWCFWLLVSCSDGYGPQHSQLRGSQW